MPTMWYIIMIRFITIYLCTISVIYDRCARYGLLRYSGVHCHDYVVDGIDTIYYDIMMYNIMNI